VSPLPKKGLSRSGAARGSPSRGHPPTPPRRGPPQSSASHLSWALVRGVGNRPPSSTPISSRRERRSARLAAPEPVLDLDRLRSVAEALLAGGALRTIADSRNHVLTARMGMGGISRDSEELARTTTHETKRVRGTRPPGGRACRSVRVGVLRGGAEGRRWLSPEATGCAQAGRYTCAA